MYAFNYHRPESLAEAAELFGSTEDPVYVAGGHTMIPTLKQRLASPSDVIDLAGVSELVIGIRVDGAKLLVGALTCHTDVAASREVNETIPALATLAGGIGDPQVRNRGTIGGSIANADPAADYPAAVLGLAATITTDQREIEGDAFFTGMFDTALEPGEIITQISFAVPEKAAYCKFPNPASRYATVGVMVSVTSGNVRVGVTGAAPTPFRSTALEDALTADLSVDAIDAVAIDYDGFNTDLHASAEYRGHLVTVMARRAIAAL